ncbi:MAG: CBS domain-containing protein [Planctomycetes bacterium]|nr:CBS domain-containing protein [Planctomycetota bacterium]
MTTAEQLIKRKEDKLAMLAPDATVLEAAQLMNERMIGSVLVVQQGTLAGIFTERDVMRRIVAEKRDPAKTRLSEVMTKQVACATPHTPLDEVRVAMREKRIRHMPVIAEDGRTILGMISIGDLNKVNLQAQAETIRYLKQYMSVA